MLVNDRWNIHEGQPRGAEAVTLEPTVQHSSDESSVIIKDHIQKTVNALLHFVDQIENLEGPFPPGTDHSLTKIDEAVHGSETLLSSYSGPTMMPPPGNSAGLRILRIQPGPHGRRRRLGANPTVRIIFIKYYVYTRIFPAQLFLFSPRGS